MITREIIALDTPNITELQRQTIQSIEYFSKIQRLRVEKNEFIQEKLKKISKQRDKFRDFAEQSITNVLKISSHADDIILFADCCIDDDISNYELLKLLRPTLSNATLNKNNSELLKDLLVKIKTRLETISTDITDHNVKINNTRNNLRECIDDVDEMKNDEYLAVKNNKFISYVGSAVALGAAPFTGGASLVAETFVGIGAIAFFGGAVVANNHAYEARAYSACGNVLNYLAKEVEEISPCLSEMKECLKKINEIISYCESYWTIEIENIDKIIKGLESCKTTRRPMIKHSAVLFSLRAKRIQEEAKFYIVAMRAAVNADRISG
ncbi:18864_t:CDS:2 [Funneliformis geosporum]|uniref:2485_t:CDS:1 n=1 Tax=Funneliformis geosporum TaxID=1117311 RepID=A0A9W4ST63_9GLOM|nr:18864_t:CDS:2 [Funneliformis geosporum]CAI2180670.1 2485_t:CDS:2 [Funneliformis geosporum]